MSMQLRYRSPGPVCEAFRLSRAPVRMIMGPVGSGKTSACLFQMVEIAAAQRPSPLDGIRYSKFGVIRDTYRNLQATTIPSWHNWVPKSVGHWNGEAPMTHEIVMNLPGIGTINLIVEFIALGENRVEDVMRGWEGTGAYINEADRMTREVLIYVLSRVGRYPSKKIHGGPSWYGVWLDMNAPDTENWTYAGFVEELVQGYEFFRQPSGFSPQAENLENLPDGYYDNIARGQPDWWVRRFVRNDFGYSRDGMPVYPEYNDSLHCAADELAPVRGIPLELGLDAGLTPAAIIGQRMPNGQRRVLDEIATTAGAGLGPARFSALLNDLLKERYDGLPIAGGSADPSAAFGQDDAAGEKSWIQSVAANTGITIIPAPTNALTPRLEAVRIPLTRLIDGHTPGLLISPRCKALRKGFNSNYRYRRLHVVGDSRYQEVPDKNDASHPHDGLQYLMLRGDGYREAMGRKAARDDGRRQIAAVTEDNPTGTYEGGGPSRGQTHAETD